MKNLKNRILATSIAGAFLTSIPVHAAAWIGGTGFFHDPTGWDTGSVPDSAAQENFLLNADGGDLTANADTWTYLTDNSLLNNSTTYRGVSRALFGQTQSGTQTVSFTLDIGNANTFQLTQNASNNFGERQNTTTTVNIVSGTMETGGQATFANNALGTATLNVSGGTFRVGRSTLRVGLSGSNALASISGGSLTTRSGIEVDTNSTLEVLGSGASLIGAGSHSSGDGIFTLAGTLRAMIDGGGVTQVTVADQGGASAAATFDAGSILDMGFLGTPAANGTWTILELQNADITDNGLALAAGDEAAGWSFNVDNGGTNGLLTATFVPEPSVALLGGLGLLGLLRRRRD